MSRQRRDLKLVYEPDEGWADFVLYTEPLNGAVASAFNATVVVEGETPYAREWLGRLERCEPNTLHTTLVSSDKIPALFHPCVHEDKDSPAAIAGSGCVCFQTWYDPEFGLPVVADHYRTVGGAIESWKYKSYAPLDLRRRDTFAALIIDQGAYFWIRTTDGVLSFLPERTAHGYGVGYGGGGPAELARYIRKLIDSNGQDTASTTSWNSDLHPGIFAWVSSKDATESRELTLDDLRGLCG